VLYFHWFAHTFGLLHGFTKKTRATPRGELGIASKRRSNWLGRPGPQQPR
jgi:phage-related protein